ncbi:MAG: sirohydrochlorin cobaltochelatase [Lachnospiraceae bacterium]|nr:sirohydrochlorin cobaltochelatase [Lachnospiraceae bacterium]
MKKDTKKAILVVSFGTSHNDTREKTIDVIENDIREAYPDYQVNRAWTSKMIMRRVLQRDGVKIWSVSEAMEAMKQQGIEDVIIQPTHVINGLENEGMKEAALRFQDDFHSIRFGNPLLTTEEDLDEMTEAMAKEYENLAEKEALVLMGHGTAHYADTVYAAMDYRFKDKGYSNIFLGTVEAYPRVDSLKRMLAAFAPRKLYLAPFMIVAGDHAKNDLSGEDESSWYRQFKREGYEVECILKGLGEYKSVRKIFLRHIASLIREASRLCE